MNTFLAVLITIHDIFRHFGFKESDLIAWFLMVIYIIIKSYLLRRKNY